jgi:hypothetical protein
VCAHPRSIDPSFHVSCFANVNVVSLCVHIHVRLIRLFMHVATGIARLHTYTLSLTCISCIHAHRSLQATDPLRVVGRDAVGREQSFYCAHPSHVFHHCATLHSVTLQATDPLRVVGRDAVGREPSFSSALPPLSASERVRLRRRYKRYLYENGFKSAGDGDGDGSCD